MCSDACPYMIADTVYVNGGGGWRLALPGQRGGYARLLQTWPPVLINSVISERPFWGTSLTVGARGVPARSMSTGLNGNQAIGMSTDFKRLPARRHCY